MFLNRVCAAAALAVAITVPGAAAFAQQPAAAPSAPAQTTPEGGHRHGGMMRRAFRGITLTDAQKQQIQQIVQQQHQAMQNQTQPPDPATRRANQEKLRSQIEAVLTPAQRTQFEQNLKSMHNHEGQGAEGRPGGAAPAPAGTPAS